jgi:ABC-type branched-subunit amino acid transport system substrate-binding protein
VIPRLAPLAVNDAIRAEPDLYVVSLALDSTTTTEDIFAPLFRNRLSINIILSSNVTTVQSILTTAYEIYGMYDDGNAWLVVGLEPWQAATIFDHAPPGTVFANQLDIAPGNETAFKNLMDTLPGADGISYIESGHLYDAVKIVGNAIKANKPSPSRANVRDSIAISNTYGYTGNIIFDSNGFRAGSWAQIVNTVQDTQSGNVTHAFVFNWHGATQTFVEVGAQSAITWPGSTTIAPTSTEEVYNVVWLVDAAGLGLPQNVLPEILSYASDVVNNNINTSFAVSVIPAGHRMRLSTVDVGSTPQTGIPIGLAMANYGVHAVLTHGGSALDELLQNILSPFEIVQFASAATASFLSDKTKYPTFLRNVAPGDEQGLALINLAKYYKWGEIGVVYTSDNYGSSLFQSFSQAALSNGISWSSIISMNPNSNRFADDIKPFVEGKPRVVFLITSAASTAKTLKAFKTLGFNPDAIIGSDTLYEVMVSPTLFGMQPADFSGMVASTPAGGYGPKYEAFKQDIALMPPTSLVRVYHEVAPIFATLFIDSVLALADSMVRMINNGVSPTNKTALLEYLYTTDATLLTGRTKFNQNGDRLGAYSLINVVGGTQKVVGRMSGTGIGLVEDDGVPETSDTVLISDPIVWMSGSTEVPVASWPREVKWLRWSSPGGILFSILASFGIALCIFMFVIMIHQKDSPVIRVATWEFLCVMLLGAALGFGSMFTWIGMPRTWICALRIWLPPMAFILIMAPLLAKTWRLHKIFTLANLKVVPIPLWRLVVMCIALALVQLVICIFWIAMGTIQPKITNDPNDRNVAYLTCGSNSANQVSAYVTYGYLGLLMVVGSYITFRVRNLPKDFNESRWIGLSIYNTLLFSIIILILGYALSKFPVTVLILICVCTFAISMGSIIFMMAPKLWTLLHHPEKRSSGSSGRISSKAGSAASKDSKIPTRRHDFSRGSTYVISLIHHIFFFTQSAPCARISSSSWFQCLKRQNSP